MQNYIDQLLADIANATENVSLPFIDTELHLHDWITNEEEEKAAPVRDPKSGQELVKRFCHLVKC